jgi:hypothetical protein
MKKYKRLKVLPEDIQRDFGAELHKGRRAKEDDIQGVFRLVDIHTTEPGSNQEQRVIANVLDENCVPMSGGKVAFSYSTAKQFVLGQEYSWMPPAPRKALLVNLTGGVAEQIQGSVIQKGQQGGITVYVLHPDYSSDWIVGCGMLADHTGLCLTFQLQETSTPSILDELEILGNRVTELETQLLKLKRDGVEEYG